MKLHLITEQHFSTPTPEYTKNARRPSPTLYVAENCIMYMKYLSVLPYMKRIYICCVLQ